MNIFLNEYFGFCFELNFELNHFSARFNEKMNFQNVSNRATLVLRTSQGLGGLSVDIPIQVDRCRIFGKLILFGYGIGQVSSGILELIVH